MNAFATFRHCQPPIKTNPLGWKRWLPALLLLACAPLFAQVPFTAWSQSYNGPRSGLDDAVGLVTDAAGNVYVTGTSASATSADYLTIKYSPFGGTL